VLKVEQTLTCDICGKQMNSLTQIVVSGTAMQQIGRGPMGMTGWQDVCVECHIPLLNAIHEAKKAINEMKKGN